MMYSMLIPINCIRHPTFCRKQDEKSTTTAIDYNVSIFLHNQKELCSSVSYNFRLLRLQERSSFDQDPIGPNECGDW
jgi:hypothetical protein